MCEKDGPFYRRPQFASGGTGVGIENFRQEVARLDLIAGYTECVENTRFAGRNRNGIAFGDFARYKPLVNGKSYNFTFVHKAQNRYPGYFSGVDVYMVGVLKITQVIP
jgi:hypothetical protein